MDNVAAGTKQGIADYRSTLQRELSESIEQVGTLRGLLNFIAQEVKYFETVTPGSRKKPGSDWPGL